jgi:hypothetical protein
MLAAAVCQGQDALLSSWQFPYWKADFGGGGPLRCVAANTTQSLPFRNGTLPVLITTVAYTLKQS